MIGAAGGDYVNLQELTFLSGRPGGLRRRHHGHAADRRDNELDALARAEPRSAHDLNLGQLVVVVADAVHGLRAKDFAPPEFTDSEFHGLFSALNVPIAASSEDTRGLERRCCARTLPRSESSMVHPQPDRWKVA